MSMSISDMSYGTATEFDVSTSKEDLITSVSGGVDVGFRGVLGELES